MERRNFLKFFSVGTVAAMGSHLVWRSTDSTPTGIDALDTGAFDTEVLAKSPAQPSLSVTEELAQQNVTSAVFEDMVTDPVEMFESIEMMSTPAPDAVRWLKAFKPGGQVAVNLVERPRSIASYLKKMQNFEDAHLDDVFLEADQYPLLVSVFKRIDRVQNLVGHGNFNVISFDEMRKIAKQYQSVGAFPQQELDFVEAIFADNVRRYGFYGDKVTTELTASIARKDRVKVKYTGHFLFRGDSFKSYQKLHSDVGDNIVLTSGIRSIVKQTHLFLAKTIQAKGNLSRASRSLAPPGHSFHGVGDFDVGKVGFGPKNFTTDFAKTDEFKRLVDLGYVDMRYPEDNLLGVRYEPWHIKVV